MNDDGFILVKSTRRGRKPKRLTRHHLGTHRFGDDHELPEEVPLSTIRKIVNDAKSSLETSGFSECVLSKVVKALQGDKIDQIRALGVGNFSSTRDNGTYQLALLEVLRERFGLPPTSFQDPVVTETERLYLQEQGIQVLPPEDLMSSCGPKDLQKENKEDNAGAATLLFMPHCEHYMYENILASYWSPTRLGRIVIFGNDFHSIVDSLPRCLLQDYRLLESYASICESHDEITGGKYTHEPLRVNRLGGRDPETGRKVNQHIGGGTKFDYFMIDFHRRGPNAHGETYDERIIEVRRDPNRSANIALVAGLHGKRWIIATENMKAGQIISTSGYIPENNIIGREGNAYPLGALAPGTLINTVERYPTPDSDVFVVLAGSAAEIVRHQGDYTVVRLPHKHEFSMHKTCMCTVGRVSNAEYLELEYGSAQMHRRFGYKMSSGLWHKKDGYQGRKIYPQPPVRVLDTPPEAPPEKIKFTLTSEQLSGHQGNNRVPVLVSHTQWRFEDV
ncbi:Protein MRPL-2 [Aphelenchoides avenae]|nr:Protein MRPL-2 [Aphelenchus avenae]